MIEISDVTHKRHHFAFCVQYHGGAFRGWQRSVQAGIQGELERALGTIAMSRLPTCGRAYRRWGAARVRLPSQPTNDDRQWPE